MPSNEKIADTAQQNIIETRHLKKHVSQYWI